jgi:hypothetical protein
VPGEGVGKNSLFGQSSGEEEVLEVTCSLLLIRKRGQDLLFKMNQDLEWEETAGRQ